MQSKSNGHNASHSFHATDNRYTAIDPVNSAPAPHLSMQSSVGNGVAHYGGYQVSDSNTYWRDDARHQHYNPTHASMTPPYAPQVGPQVGYELSSRPPGASSATHAPSAPSQAPPSSSYSGYYYHDESTMSVVPFRNPNTSHDPYADALRSQPPPPQLAHQRPQWAEHPHPAQGSQHSPNTNQYPSYPASSSSFAQQSQPMPPQQPMASPSQWAMQVPSWQSAPQRQPLSSPPLPPPKPPPEAFHRPHYAPETPPHIVHRTKQHQHEGNRWTDTTGSVPPHTATTTSSHPVLQNLEPPESGASSAPLYHPGATQLIVNYLAPSVTSGELHDLFAPFGTLDGARVIYDRTSGTTKGYGFVYFRDGRSAQAAVSQMNGLELHGKWLKVAFSTNPLQFNARKGRHAAHHNQREPSRGDGDGGTPAASSSRHTNNPINSNDEEQQ